MAVNEQEIELLESYLDDALDMGEVEALRARLASDPEWVAALDQIRAERALRKELFAALEPNDEAVAALVSSVQTSIGRRRRLAVWLHPMRYVAAAAACLVLGFVGRGFLDRPHPAVDQASKSGVDVQRVASYQVTLRDEAGNVVAVQRFDSIDKAQEFAADLARWQARSERLASGRFVLSADRF
jgi:anti-sigma factor RsiW